MFDVKDFVHLEKKYRRYYIGKFPLGINPT